MIWEEFAHAVPDLAMLGEERFRQHELCLVGTLRSDGWPRISPVEPWIVAGSLYLSMIWQSTKALDLLRDPRCLVHSAVCNRDGTEGEFKLYGQAAEASDTAVRERVYQAIQDRHDWRPPQPDHLFYIDIGHAAFVRFRDEGRETISWSPKRGFQRSVQQVD
jgi:hypothetical protein